jgi:hypothetical protein
LVLFRKNVDPDYGRPTFSIHFNIGSGILKPVKDWDTEGKDVVLTRGLGRTICFRVLKAKALDQAGIPESQRFIYECPWGLADFLGAVRDFESFLWESIKEEIPNKIKRTERPLAFGIFGKAYQLAERARV